MTALAVLVVVVLLTAAASAVLTVRLCRALGADLDPMTVMSAQPASPDHPAADDHSATAVLYAAHGFEPAETVAWTGPSGVHYALGILNGPEGSYATVLTGTDGKHHRIYHAVRTRYPHGTLLTAAARRSLGGERRDEAQQLVGPAEPAAVVQAHWNAHRLVTGHGAVPLPPPRPGQAVGVLADEVAGTHAGMTERPLRWLARTAATAPARRRSRTLLTERRGGDKEAAAVARSPSHGRP